MRGINYRALGYIRRKMLVMAAELAVVLRAVSVAPVYPVIPAVSATAKQQ